MKIIMTKRKPGIYGFEWFIIEGVINNKYSNFLISWNQAKTYAQAIRFFKQKWPEAKGLTLRNAEPLSGTLWLAA